MMNSNIYFRGFVFNDKFNKTNITKEKTYEYIDAVFNFDTITSEKIIKNIKFIDSYNNFYFITELIEDNALNTIYSSIIFDNTGKIRKNIFIYHFFKIEEKYCDYIKFYQYISNIENMERLIIAFIYYLIKNIELYKIETSDIIIARDINTYTTFFLDIDKEQINLEKLINWYRKNEKNSMKCLHNKIKNYSKEYDKLIKLKDKVDKIIIDNKLKEIRGIVAHNKMTFGYNNKINTTSIANINDNISICKEILKELNILLKKLMKKHIIYDK